MRRRNDANVVRELNRYLAIHGEPGSGKSEVLVHAAVQAASDAKARLPNAALLEIVTCEYAHAPGKIDIRTDGSLRGNAQVRLSGGI